MLAMAGAAAPLIVQISGQFPGTINVVLSSRHFLFPLSSSTLASMNIGACPVPRCVAVRSKLASEEGFWEEPNEGVDGEYDGLDEEENGSEDEGEEEEAKVYSVVVDKKSLKSHEREEIIKEVEMLLGPEEKAILQQNEVANLSKISTNKWNPLHSFALSIQIPFMDELLERGVDIDSLDNDGFTVLHKAIIGKKEAVISHLLRKGANPHVRDKDGATAMHHAVQVGAIQTVKLLIKCKVDVNAEDNDGWTPLHLAIQCRSRDITKVLLVNGADRTRRNKDGKTPLDISLCYGKDFKSYELAKLLKLVPANRDL